MKTRVVSANDLTPLLVAKIVQALQKGDVVVFPTETVYGLGADITSERGVVQIYTTKGRPADNPLIAHVSSLEMAETLAPLDERARRLATEFWPGPLTLVVKKHQGIADRAAAYLPTLGIRMPDHSIALNLIAALGNPIAAPSANLSGKPSATQAVHALTDFDGSISFIIDGGPSQVGVESTILDISEPQAIILRPGILTVEEISAALGEPVLDFVETQTSDASPKAPGMKYRHYAPTAQLKLFGTEKELQQHITPEIFTATWMLSPDQATPTWILETATHHNLPIFAYSLQSLFSLFRQADQEAIRTILLFLPPEGISTALHNRIAKAAGVL